MCMTSYQASNPGTFDNDTDMLWGRAASANSICYMVSVAMVTVIETNKLHLEC